MPTPMPETVRSAEVPLNGGRSVAAIAAGLSSAVLMAVPARVSAHPGDHGHDWLMTAWHLLSEPDHVAGILIALVVGFYGLRRVRARRDRHNPPGH